MFSLRRFSVPLLVLALTAGLVYGAFDSRPSSADAAGVLAGWIGYGLLLCSLVLMIREPWPASALGGLERLYRWHHWAGLAGYIALLVHPLALASGALPQFPRRAWQMLSPFGAGFTVWSGWLSLLLLMLGLAATFERRLSYRTRRRLHAASGGGVLLGTAHLAALGVDEPVELFAGFIVLLLLWRAVRCDWGVGARPYVVKSSHPVAEATVEIALAPLAEPIDATPGQFMEVAFAAGPSFVGCREFHPFTIAGVDGDGRLRIAVKAEGDCTRLIQTVTPGTSARVQGAFGALFAEGPPRAALWVAGGVGVTPFLAVLRSGRLVAPTTFIYLFRAPGDAAFLDELEALARREPSLEWHPIATGTTLPDLRAILPDANALAGRDCYIAGPPGLIHGVERVLRSRGVARRRIHCETLQEL